VTDESAAASAVKAAIASFGSLEVVINNAGYGISRPSKTRRCRIFAHNRNESFGTIIVTKAALPYFRQRKAVICSVSSMGGRIGLQAWALFGGEMGCRGFLRSVVARSGAASIKVTIVEPVLPHGLRRQFHQTERRKSRLRLDC